MTENNDMIDILTKLLENAKMGDGAKERGRALKVAIKCTNNGVEEISEEGSKAIFVVFDGKKAKSGMFGMLSPIDVGSMLLAMLNAVAEIDDYDVDGETVALGATGAFLEKILERRDGGE